MKKKTIKQFAVSITTIIFLVTIIVLNNGCQKETSTYLMKPINQASITVVYTDINPDITIACTQALAR